MHKISKPQDPQSVLQRVIRYAELTELNENFGSCVTVETRIINLLSFHLHFSSNSFVSRHGSIVKLLIKICAIQTQSNFSTISIFYFLKILWNSIYYTYEDKYDKCGTFVFSLNVLNEFVEFSDKNICHYSKRTQTCHTTTSCVSDQAATTVPARHM